MNTAFTFPARSESEKRGGFRRKRERDCKKTERICIE